MPPVDKRMSKPLLVNLYGAPAAGKSTLAAQLFAALKLEGFKVELCREYVKDLVWQGMTNEQVSQRQLSILAKQFESMRRLSSCDVIVTDSPIHLCAFYSRNTAYRHIVTEQICDALENWFRPLNFFLLRTRAFTAHGRYQTEAQANQISLELTAWLGSRLKWRNIVYSDRLCAIKAEVLNHMAIGNAA